MNSLKHISIFPLNLFFCLLITHDLHFKNNIKTTSKRHKTSKQHETKQKTNEEKS